MSRRLGTIALLLTFALAVVPSSPAQNPPELPAVQLNTESNAGRPVEDLTRKSVARDYARAWRTLNQALTQNRAEGLENDFVGVAQEKLAAAVEDQAKAGLHRRYVDHGHKVDVLFYSPDGVSIQLRDTANVELQVLDGDRLIHSEQLTLHYISLMTPTEVRWKVRLLQEIPGS